MNSKSVHRFIFVTLIFLLLISPAKAKSSLQTTPIVQSDPVEQCAQGMVLLTQQGRIAKAQPLLQSGFDSLQSDPNADKNSLSRCAYFLAMTHHQIGNWTAALEQYHFALDIFKDIGDAQLEWSALFGIGSIYMAQERHPEAQERLEQALSLTEQTDPEWVPNKIRLLAQAVTLNNLGINTGLQIQKEAAAEQGYDRSRVYFSKALSVLDELEAESGDERGIKELLLDMLSEQFGLSEEEMVLMEFFLMAIPEDEMCSGDKAMLKVLLSLLTNAGKDLSPEEQGELQESLMLNILAEGMRTLTPSFKTLFLNNIAETYRFEKEYDTAMDYYAQAQETMERRDELESCTVSPTLLDLSNTAIIHNNIGLVRYATGQNEEALTHFEQSLEIMRSKLDHRMATAALLTNMGFIYEEQGELDNALAAYTEAMELLERVRVVGDSRVITITGSNQLQTSSFVALNGTLAPYADLYWFASNLYHRQNQDEAAFYTTERSRARLFLDMVAAGQLQLSDPETGRLLTEYYETYALLGATETALTQARTLQSENVLTNPQNQMAISALEQDLAEIKATHEEIRQVIIARNDDLTSLIPGFWQKKQKDYILGVAQVQAHLDEQTTLISYFTVNAERTLAFLITPDSFEVVELEISVDELERQVNAIRDFANLSKTPPENAITLYGRLIEPFKDRLITPHLAIVPHRVLHYLPFAALTDGERYLIDDYSLTVLPSASSLPFIRKNTEQVAGIPLILGNPTTGEYAPNPLLAAERNELGPLPFAEKEAQAITDLLGVEPLIEEEATETVVRQEAAGTNILHLAAHGVYNPVIPLNSLIALAPDEKHDGWLTVGEVYGLELSQADLVVLSACETQLGKLSRGDELVGLTRAFVYAGAPSILASLWTVDDEATALLMTRFYKNLQAGMSKAQALRQAQMDIRADYPHPYYWAAFVLSGDGERGQ